MEETNRTNVQNTDPTATAVTPESTEIMEITERKNSEETASQSQTGERFPAVGGGLPNAQPDTPAAPPAIPGTDAGYRPLFPAADPHLPGNTQDDPDPTPAEIRRHIIRRVSELIGTCTDPKKLMDTHEALLKWEQAAVRPQESLFERIARELAENDESDKDDKDDEDEAVR